MLIFICNTTQVMRTIRLGSFGFLIHGTTGHYFYGFLDGKLPGTAPMTVATKVAIDQTMYVYILLQTSFLHYSSLMQSFQLRHFFSPKIHFIPPLSVGTPSSVSCSSDT